MGRARERREDPGPAHHADRRCGDPWHGADCTDALLGADGVLDHGRPHGGDGADAAFSACGLCARVPGAARRRLRASARFGMGADARLH